MEDSQLPLQSESDPVLGEEEQIPIGQVLFALREVKEDIISEVKQRSESLRQELSEKLEAVKSSIVENVSSFVSCQSMDSRSAGCRPRGSGAKAKNKRRPPAPESIPYLREVCEGDRDVLPHLRWLMLLTILSFANGQRNARFWISDDVLENTSEAAQQVEGVSGLSLIFFAVPRVELRARYTGKIAQAWSLALRNAVVGMIFDSRKALNGTTPGRIPTWLSSFGGRRKATALVASVFAALERRGETGTSSSGEDSEGVCNTKRRRLSEGEEVDAHAGARSVAVKTARANVMYALTHGRTEARRQLFLRLLFLVEKIASFGSVEEAKQSGFEFVVRTMREDIDSMASNAGESEKSRWGIPKAETAGDDIDEKNLSSFQQMQKDFPELTVTLRFSKNVRQRRGVPEPATNLTWPVTEEVSLHSVASSVIIGAYKVDSFEEMVRSCELSLFVIHVFAIGLRGIVRQSLGLRLTGMEKCALGQVTLEKLSKGDERVTAMYGSGTRDKDDDDSNELDKMPKSKLEISWDAYEVERANMAASARSMLLRDSALSDTEHFEEEENDNDDDWLFKARAPPTHPNLEHIH